MVMTLYYLYGNDITNNILRVMFLSPTTLYYSLIILKQGWLAQCQFKVSNIMFIYGMVLRCACTLNPA